MSGAPASGFKELWRNLAGSEEQITKRNRETKKVHLGHQHNNKYTEHTFSKLPKFLIFIFFTLGNKHGFLSLGPRISCLPSSHSPHTALVLFPYLHSLSLGALPKHHPSSCVKMQPGQELSLTFVDHKDQHTDLLVSRDL